RPDVYVSLARVLVDLGKFLGAEVEVPEPRHNLLHLLGAAGADQRGGDTRFGRLALAQDPGDRHLREALAAAPGDPVERAYVGDVLLVQELLPQRLALRGATVLGDALEVLVGQHSLRQRREDDGADAQLAERFEEPVLLHPAVDHGIARLVDEAGRAELLQDRHRLTGALGVVGGNPDIERAAGTHDVVERDHRLFERRIRVEAVGVEDIDIVESHALQALVAAGDQILAAAPFAVWTGPHQIARLG